MSRDFTMGALTGAAVCLVLSFVAGWQLNGRVLRFEKQAAVAASAAARAQVSAKTAETERVQALAGIAIMQEAIEAERATARRLRGEIGALRRDRPAADGAMVRSPECSAICAPAIASREAEIDLLEQALTSTQAQADTLVRQRDNALALVEVQKLSLADLKIAVQEAKDAISKAPLRQGLFTRLRPKIAVGYGAQLTDGQVRFGPSATLGVVLTP